MESVLRDNAATLELAKQHGANYILIDDIYRIEMDI